MVKQKMEFIGLLANVDSSILNLELEHGFKIDSMSLDEFSILFSKLKETPPFSVISQESNFHLICKNQIVYYVSNSTKDALEVDDRKNPEFFQPAYYKFHELVREYLDKTLRVMRLFKEGNICMPSYYLYYLKDNVPRLSSSISTILNLTAEPFFVSEREISLIHDFIDRTTIPFKQPFVQLAFENFELSYRVSERELSYLSLMIALEALFHPSNQGELSYRISRNVAVLIGSRETKASREIIKDVKELYRKRSALIHTGEIKINDADILLLRYYVRESIKKINDLNFGKDELSDFLTSKGFNE